MKNKTLSFPLCVVVPFTFATLLRAQDLPRQDARQLLQGAHETTGLARLADLATTRVVK